VDRLVVDLDVGEEIGVLRSERIDLSAQLLHSGLKLGTFRCGDLNARRGNRLALLEGEGQDRQHGARHFGSSHLSVKKSAATILPGQREFGGVVTSTTAQSGSLGTCRALFR